MLADFVFGKKPLQLVGTHSALLKILWFLTGRALGADTADTGFSQVHFLQVTFKLQQPTMLLRKKILVSDSVIACPLHSCVSVSQGLVMESWP